MGAWFLQLALNGLWQGLLLVATVALVMRWSGHRLRPGLRCRLWYATLLAIVILPPLGLLASTRSPARARPEARAPVTPGVTTTSLAPADRSDGAAPAAASRQASAPEAIAPSADPHPDFRSAAPTIRVGSRWLAALVIAYALIAGMLLSGVALALLRVRRLRATLRPLPPEAVASIDRVRAYCRMRRPVRIGVSEAVGVPVTLGFFRPTILIPTAIMRDLEPGALAQVIGHELAHVARRDDWARLAQRVLGALLFFHPAVHWATRRIELERELACDDWALARTGARPDVYARCLLRVGELATGQDGAPRLALSMASQLRIRVLALLTPRRAGTAGGRAPLGVGALVCGASLLMVSPGVRIQVGADAATAAGIGPEGWAETARARLEAALGRYEEYGLHGAVLVIHGDRILLSDGYGLSDRERGTPWTAATAFNGGAVAKMLTSAAILKLEEQGRLRVTDRIADYLGAFPAPKDRATIHHLLTHTAGLAQPWAPVFRGDRDDFVQAMKSTPLDYPPGEGHRYTDLGHALLAAVIEVASGMSYEEFVRTALLEPAGMWNTRFDDDPASAGPLAVEYAQAAGTRSRVGPREYPWGRRGAMGVITTLDDLWRWHRALERGAILGPEARARMLTGWVDAGRTTRIGYGWEVGRSDRGTRIRHRLSAWSSNSVEVAYDEDEDLFIALVANAPTNWGRPKYVGLMDAALGRPHLMPPAPRVPRVVLDGLGGRYRTASGAGVDVRVASPGALHLTALGQDDEMADLLGGARTRNSGAVVVARAVDGAPGEFRLLDWSRHRVLRLRFDTAGASSLEVNGGSRTLRAFRVTN